MRFPPDQLERLVSTIFAAAGSAPAEADCVSGHLVEANLVGHDSHGVIRVPAYVKWVREGKLFANRQPQILLRHESLALVDGQLGFGQVMARETMRLAVDMARQAGIAAVGLRNSGHVGRVGAWAALAARENLIGMCYVNTSGGGILVAPFGGIDRRVSANPIALAAPWRPGCPLVLDMSTCAIAEGKIRVALNKGQKVPEGCIIDAQGRPTNDPQVFYADPPGAILPVGGHKGFGLGVMVEVLAGALTGGLCSRPGIARLEQAMLAIVIDPARFQPQDAFAAEIARYVEFVKGSRTLTPQGEILMPGEPEQRTRVRRTAEGIDLDETTWQQIQDTARLLEISAARVDECLRG